MAWLKDNGFLFQICLDSFFKIIFDTNAYMILVSIMFLGVHIHIQIQNPIIMPKHSIHD
jgi:hypothetical protein